MAGEKDKDKGSKDRARANRTASKDGKDISSDISSPTKRKVTIGDNKTMDKKGTLMDNNYTYDPLEDNYANMVLVEHDRHTTLYICQLYTSEGVVEEKTFKDEDKAMEYVRFHCTIYKPEKEPVH